MGEGVYNIAAFGENATKFMRLLAAAAPSAGGEYLSEKFEEFMKEAQVEVRVDNIRETDSGNVAANLTISAGGIGIKYNVYLSKNAIELKFESTDRSRVELAALLLRLAGVDAEVKKKKDSRGRDVWQVYASTDMLAAGREELRKALAEVVKTAVKKKRVDAGTAERWLKKLESGITLMEGWPKYHVGLVESSLVVSFRSTDPKSIEQAAQQLEMIGLKRGVHFSVKMPAGGKAGYM